MSTALRDLGVWVSRMRECRNPFLLASGLNYDRLRSQILKLATGQPFSVTANYMREIEDDKPFLQEIRARLAKWTMYTPRAVDFMMSGRSGSVFFNEVTLYAIVRALRPEVVIETGGTPGKSTAFILRALERNKTGHLYTLDLPPAVIDQPILQHRGIYHELRPAGAESGWIVPDELRGRQTALLGSSKDHLPPLLEKLDRVDMFYHDSDHSYDYMTWEFETVWPKLKSSDGLLMSDDVLANNSFFDFCKKIGLTHLNVFNLGAARRQ